MWDIKRLALDLADSVKRVEDTLGRVPLYYDRGVLEAARERAVALHGIVSELASDDFGALVGACGDVIGEVHGRCDGWDRGRSYIVGYEGVPVSRWWLGDDVGVTPEGVDVAGHGGGVTAGDGVPVVVHEPELPVPGEDSDVPFSGGVKRGRPRRVE